MKGISLMARFSFYQLFFLKGDVFNHERIVREIYSEAFKSKSDKSQFFIVQARG